MPLECGVCLGRYSDAAQLPCGHSFCGACLCTILSGPAAARLCPACRRPALQPNFALADAVKEEEALRGQLYEAKVELSRSRAEVEGLGGRLALSQKELARAKQESSALRSRLSEGVVQELQGKLRESQEAGAELERRLEAVSGENGRLRTRLEERGAAAERAKALLADSEELCRSLVQRLGVKEAEAEEEKAKAAACEAQLGTLRSVLLGGQAPAPTDKASQEIELKSPESEEVDKKKVSEEADKTAAEEAKKKAAEEAEKKRRQEQEDRKLARRLAQEDWRASRGRLAQAGPPSPAQKDKPGAKSGAGAQKQRVAALTRRMEKLSMELEEPSDGWPGLQTTSSPASAPEPEKTQPEAPEPEAWQRESAGGEAMRMDSFGRASPEHQESRSQEPEVQPPPGVWHQSAAENFETASEGPAASRSTELEEPGASTAETGSCPVEAPEQSSPPGSPPTALPEAGLCGKYKPTRAELGEWVECCVCGAQGLHLSPDCPDIAGHTCGLCCSVGHCRYSCASHCLFCQTAGHNVRGCPALRLRPQRRKAKGKAKGM